METLSMTTLKTISRALNFKRVYAKPEKLLVIIDQDHISLLDEVLHLRFPPMQVMYIISDSPEIRLKYKSTARIYPLNVNIRSLLRHDIVDEILCCTGSISVKMFEDLKQVCNQFGVPLLLPDFARLPGMEVLNNRKIGKYLFNVLETTPRRKFIFYLKNIWEPTFAAIALSLLSPLLILIALSIKVDSRGPVIFRQLRVGRRGRKFYIYKFRTMVVDAEHLKEKLKEQNEADGPAFKIKNDPRITRVGRLLRKTGFDEVPQLYNVLTGNMSLIGPRPMLPSEVSEQKEWQLKRLCIKPGITCTWQINPNRNKVPFDEWMKLDRDYVENWSVFKDVGIFIGTIKSFFAARGV
jgi:lipopolysaccharide/colanic/teichoic acid biosynthesis glycosyltransferase